jgi:hypothetical protein
VPQKSEFKKFVNKTLGSIEKTVKSTKRISEFSKNENFLVCIKEWREH